MKKFLVLVLALLVLGSVAFAGGDMHECDLCGRMHAGIFCPEACLEDCSLEEIHKWYDCPDLNLVRCWNCYDASGNHYAQICPDGDLVWNDEKGCFRSKEFAGEYGTRMSRMCDICGYYGYHYTSECLNNPNRNDSVTVPESNGSCATHYFNIEYQEVVSQEAMTGNYCQVTEYRNHLVCDSCGEKDEEMDETKVEHEMYNGKCSICGYTNNGWEANVESEPEADDEPEVNVGVNASCAHTGKTLLSRYGNFEYKEVNGECIRYFTQRTRCASCNELLDERIVEEEIQHKWSKGICLNCKVAQEMDDSISSEENSTTGEVDVETNVDADTKTEAPAWWIIASGLVAFLVIACYGYKKWRRARRARRARRHA